MGLGVLQEVYFLAWQWRIRNQYASINYRYRVQIEVSADFITPRIVGLFVSTNLHFTKRSDLEPLLTPENTESKRQPAVIVVL